MGVFDTFPALFQISLNYFSKEKIPATGGQFRGYRGFSRFFISSFSRIFSILQILDLQLSGSRFLGSSRFLHPQFLLISIFIFLILNFFRISISSHFHPDFLVLLDFWESVDFARFRPDFGHSQSLCKSLV